MAEWESSYGGMFLHNARLLTNEEIKDMESQIPLGRLGNSIEIAKCVNWLIEDNYTTGQIISPNGGWVI